MRVQKAFQLGTFIPVFALQVTIFHVTPLTGLSIRPPSEEIFSNQICPDPTMVKGDSTSSTAPISPKARMPEKLMAINLDKPKDSIHFYESCTFKEQWEQGTALKWRPKHSVRVRSVNINSTPWNFSTAQNCSNFIKFNNWDDHDGGRYPVLCGRENFDQFLGPYGHPMVLYYQWKNGGLSFPLFYSNYAEHHEDKKDTLELQYMQIYFSIMADSKDSMRKCRVQQYRLDWLRLGCTALLTEGEVEPVCGEYSCDELEALYQSRMTILKDGESENDTVLIWKTKNDKYKMRTFLRQKFVPVVFLIVLICAYRSYMKAGLRYQNSMQDDIPDIRVRSFRLQRHIPRGRGPGPTADPSYWEFDDEVDAAPPAYRIFDATVVPVEPFPPGAHVLPKTLAEMEEEGEVDPPPSYESVCPPTYKDVVKP